MINNNVGARWTGSSFNTGVNACTLSSNSPDLVYGACVIVVSFNVSIFLSAFDAVLEASTTGGPVVYLEGYHLDTSAARYTQRAITALPLITYTLNLTVFTSDNPATGSFVVTALPFTSQLQR